MKATVDADTCIGCELCVDTCPKVFRMTASDVSEAFVDPVPAEEKDCAQEAADICPVSAIEIAP